MPTFARVIADWAAEHWLEVLIYCAMGIFAAMTLG